MKRVLRIAKQEIAYYKNSEFFKNFFKLFSGIGIAQLIPIITAPLLTRIYSPEAYGVLGIFSTIVGVAGSFSCLKYNQAIVPSKEVKDIINLSFICLILCVFFTAIVTILIISIPDIINQLFDQSIANSVLFLIPVLVFFRGLSLVAESINVKYKYFGDISYSRILQSSGGRGFTIVYGLIEGGYIGLIIGILVGEALRTLYIFKHIVKFLLKNIHLVSIKLTRELAIQYKKFPLYLSWAGLLSTLNEALPIWLISSNFSTEYAGYYTLVRGVLMRPSKLISESIAKPYYQKIASHTDNKEFVHNITKQLMKRMVLLTLFHYGVIAVFAPFIFSIVFGEEWITAGKITQILALFLGARFCTKSITMFTSAFGIQQYTLILQGFLIFINILCFVFLSDFLKFFNVLVIYSSLSTMVLLGILSYSYYISIYSKIQK